MKKYLDQTGLQVVWTAIVNKFVSMADSESISGANIAIFDTSSSARKLIKDSKISITKDAPDSSATDATIPTSKAVWDAINNGISANDAMRFQGVINSSAALPCTSNDSGKMTLADIKVGDTWKCATGGLYIIQKNDTTGEIASRLNAWGATSVSPSSGFTAITEPLPLEVGDMLIVTGVSGEGSSKRVSFNVIQTNVPNPVSGPIGSVTDGGIVLFDYSGNFVKDSTKTIATSVTSSATAIPTSSAIKAFVEDKGYLSGIKGTVARCTDFADVAARSATLDNYTLTANTIVQVYFQNAVIATDTGVMLNINSQGAKFIFYGGSKLTTSGVILAGDIVTFFYDGTNYNILSIERATNEARGTAYGICSTNSTTTAKTVDVSGFNLVKYGIVAVRFINTVPVSATLNINSTGAKAIYYKGSAITGDVIAAQDTATFIYDGTNYNLISLDSPQTDALTKNEIEAAIANAESQVQG